MYAGSNSLGVFEHHHSTVLYVMKKVKRSKLARVCLRELLARALARALLARAHFLRRSLARALARVPCASSLRELLPLRELLARELARGGGFGFARYVAYILVAHGLCLAKLHTP